MSFDTQSWVPFLFIAIVGLVSYNVCAKIGGGNLPPVMFASIMYTTGFIFMIPVFFFYMHGKQIVPELQSLPILPVLFTMGAGLVVIFIDLSISKMFNLDAPIGISMACLSVGSIALTALIGFVFFKEHISTINIAGIALALISVPLILWNTK